MLMMSTIALLAGCNPQDAEVQGDFAVFLDAENSENIVRLNAEEPVADRLDKLGLTPIDCRDLSSLTEEEQAEERLPGVDYAAACPADATTTWFTWLQFFQYYKRSGTFGAEGADETPWRSEAVLTSEGDLQLTVHMKLDPIGDFRFGWVIDPAFQPVECEDVDGGGAALVDVDGNWLENWSAEEEGTLWHLNAGSYQLNPSDAGDYWYLPQEWLAGYSFGRFGDEEFFGHPIDYQDPTGTAMYFWSYGDDGWLPGAQGYTAWVGNVEEALAGADELTTIGQTSFEPVFKVEDNAWRLADNADTNGDGEPDDGMASGLEDWIGVSTSWVRIDNPQDIAVDNANPVTGEFQLYLETAGNTTRVLVKGSFTINRIREDVWGYSPEMEETKREENDTPECGDYRLTE